MATDDARTMQIRLVTADEASLADLVDRLGELDVSVQERAAPPVKEGELGTVLSVTLAGSAIVAVAKALSSWLRLQSGRKVTLEIRHATSTLRIAAEIGPEDAVRELRHLLAGGGSRTWPP